MVCNSSYRGPSLASIVQVLVDSVHCAKCQFADCPICENLEREVEVGVEAGAICGESWHNHNWSATDTNALHYDYYCTGIALAAICAVLEWRHCQ